MTTQTERLFQEAKKTDRAIAFVQALKEILRRLRTKPREFGELMFSFHKAQLDVRVGIIAPASVRYVVHQAAFEVVILAVELLEAADG